jgi:hypothetical protein
MTPRLDARAVQPGTFIFNSSRGALLGNTTISTLHSNEPDAVAIAGISVPVKRLAKVGLAIEQFGGEHCA